MIEAKPIEKFTDSESSERLIEMIEGLLLARGVKATAGPPTAGFRLITGEDDSAFLIYVSFGADGPRDPGTPHPAADSLSDLLDRTMRGFGAWLQPARRLLWRTHPVVEHVDDVWRVHFRCVQLPDDRDRLVIEWPL